MYIFVNFWSIFTPLIRIRILIPNADVDPDPGPKMNADPCGSGPAPQHLLLVDPDLLQIVADPYALVLIKPHASLGRGSRGGGGVGQVTETNQEPEKVPGDEVTSVPLRTLSLLHL